MKKFQLFDGGTQRYIQPPRLDWNSLSTYTIGEQQQVQADMLQMLLVLNRILEPVGQQLDNLQKLQRDSHVPGRFHNIRDLLLKLRCYAELLHPPLDSGLAASQELADSLSEILRNIKEIVKCQHDDLDIDWVRAGGMPATPIAELMIRVYLDADPYLSTSKLEHQCCIKTDSGRASLRSAQKESSMASGGRRPDSERSDRHAGMCARENGRDPKSIHDDR